MRRKRTGASCAGHWPDGDPRRPDPEETDMIGFLVAGLVIGALARLIMPGKQNLSVLATLGLGLVGSLIGGTIAWMLGTGSIWELNFLGFLLAVVASVLLVGTAEAIPGVPRRRPPSWAPSLWPRCRVPPRACERWGGSGVLD